MVRSRLSRLSKSYSHGFTLVELMIVVVVSALLVGAITAFILSATNQFAINTARGQMNTQITSATNRLENDIRYARLILEENSVADSSAPSNDNRWNSNNTQLVLGATARNSANTPLGSDYTDKLDNYVYYLKNATLYRRVLAHPDSNNRYTTTTCPQTIEGGCTSDTTILRNVESLEFTYQDATGAETANYDEATIVKMAITTKTSQSQHTIELSNSTTFRLALADTPPQTPPGIPDLPGSINAGYGGIQVGISSSFSANGDVSTLGNFTIGSSSHVTVKDIYASHLNCGPTYNLQYGTRCPANPAPILTDGSNISLTAHSACAPATPVVTTSNSSSVISIGSLTTSCELPSALPVFDKQALVGSIPAENTTTGNINCFGNSGRTFEFQGNHRHLGDIDFSGGTCDGIITSSGVLYIDGELKLGFGSGMAIHPSVTDPVTIVVNGRIVVYNATIGNNDTPKPNIITFDSVNEACSHSTSCNSLSMQDLYDSGRSVNHGILVHHSSSIVYANFYAPFSRIRFTTSPKVETNEIYGQQVDIDHGHLGSFTVAP